MRKCIELTNHFVSACVAAQLQTCRGKFTQCRGGKTVVVHDWVSVQRRTLVYLSLCLSVDAFRRSVQQEGNDGLGDILGDRVPLGRRNKTWC